MHEHPWHVSSWSDRSPPEWAAAVLKAIRCFVRRSEGISIDAFETGTGLHVDETEDDASWETWEMVNDDDGNGRQCGNAWSRFENLSPQFRSERKSEKEKV